MSSLSCSIDLCCKFDFPKIYDARGSITFIENSRHIPFDIKRVYYLYDVPNRAERAGHAHLRLQQILIALSGSFDVHLDDGFHQRVETLNRPDVGLLLPGRIWRVINNFSSGSVCLVLASDFYDESEYIRDHGKFLELVRG